MHSSRIHVPLDMFPTLALNPFHPLNLFSCLGLTARPESTGRLTGLRKLNRLFSCPSLKALPVVKELCNNLRSSGVKANVLLVFRAAVFDDSYPSASRQMSTERVRASPGAGLDALFGHPGLHRLRAQFQKDPVAAADMLQTLSGLA